MQSKFIYTKDVDIYLKLLELGFEDLGTIDNCSEITYTVANSDTLRVPEEYRRECLFSDRMFLQVATNIKKGGDL